MTIRKTSRRLMLGALVGLASIAGAGQPATPTANASTPTVEQIVARYVDARGGADAWQKILAMGWTGHIESGAGGSDKIPFLMLFRKPDATRFEVVVQNQRSVRIFDGHRGWKQRPGGESGVELTDYTPEDVRAALDSGGLDGPLSGYKAKGVQLDLQGAELIEQRKAWKIKVTFPSGDVQWHWIDADNYHDLRYDWEVRNAMGTRGIVSVYFRNYQSIEGVSLPLLIETRSPAGQAPNRMIIERVAINPTLNADTFERPVQAGVRHNGITVNTGDPRGGGVPKN